MKVFIELEVLDDAKLCAAAEQLYLQGKVQHRPNSVDKALKAVVSTSCSADVGLRVFDCEVLPPDDISHTYDIGRYQNFRRLD